MEGPAEDPVGRGAEGKRKVEELVEDAGSPGRWAVMDFLSAADVEGLVPAGGGAGDGVVDWERRERRERRAEGEELGAAGELGAGKELPLHLPTPPSWYPHMIRSREGGGFLLFSLSAFCPALSFVVSFILSFLLRFPLYDSFVGIYLLEKAWAGKGELATCRLAQTADGKPGQKVRRHILDRLNASMIKYKKKLRRNWVCGDV